MERDRPCTAIGHGVGEKRRGLNDPLLVTSDGAPGIIKAIEVCFPRAARQRCLAHRMRNLAAKVPEDVWPDFKARAQAVYQAPSRAIARELAAGVVADYGRRYDSAVTCFMDDFEACIAHLRFPVTHRRAIRTTNLLERLFVEERRRLKIIPNAFGERAVLKLMFGALIRAAERWRSVKVTEFERRHSALATLAKAESESKKERTEDACVTAAMTDYVKANDALVQQTATVMSVEATIAQRRLQEEYCLRFVRCSLDDHKTDATDPFQKSSIQDCCMHNHNLI
jgi:hypothetical protein